MRNRDSTDKTLAVLNPVLAQLVARYGESTMRDKAAWAAAGAADMVQRWRLDTAPKQNVDRHLLLAGLAAKGFSACISADGTGDSLAEFLAGHAKRFLLELVKRADTALDGNPEPLHRMAMILTRVPAVHRNESDVGDPVAEVLLENVEGSTRNGFRQLRFPTIREVQECIKNRYGLKVDPRTIARKAKRLGVQLRHAPAGAPKGPRPKKSRRYFPRG
jgi:hypothetical protein